MSATYLLPCSCGRNLEITIAQAGEEIACPCGKKISVPTMRTIRTLARVEETGASAASSAPSWSKTQGIIFACGAVFTAVATIFAGLAILARLHMDTSFTAEMEIQATAAMIDALTPEQIFDELWRDFRDHGLGPKVTPAYEIARRQAKRQNRIVLGSLLAVALGVAITLSSLLVRTRPQT